MANLFIREYNIAVTEQVKALLEAQVIQVLMLREPEERNGSGNLNESLGLIALCGNILSIC